MTMHNEHNVLTDKAMHIILFDGCERCEEHASHPFDSLDNENLARLWVLGRAGDYSRNHEPTHNEWRAIRELQRTYLNAHRLARLSPDFMSCVTAGLAK